MLRFVIAHQLSRRMVEISAVILLSEAEAEFGAIKRAAKEHTKRKWFFIFIDSPCQKRSDRVQIGRLRYEVYYNFYTHSQNHNSKQSS